MFATSLSRLRLADTKAIDAARLETHQVPLHGLELLRLWELAVEAPDGPVQTGREGVGAAAPGPASERESTHGPRLLLLLLEGAPREAPGTASLRRSQRVGWEGARHRDVGGRHALTPAKGRAPREVGGAAPLLLGVHAGPQACGRRRLISTCNEKKNVPRYFFLFL